MLHRGQGLFQRGQAQARGRVRRQAPSRDGRRRPGGEPRVAPGVQGRRARRLRELHLRPRLDTRGLRPLGPHGGGPRQPGAGHRHSARAGVRAAPGHGQRGHSDRVPVLRRRRALQEAARVVRGEAGVPGRRPPASPRQLLPEVLQGHPRGPAAAGAAAPAARDPRLAPGSAQGGRWAAGGGQGARCGGGGLRGSGGVTPCAPRPAPEPLQRRARGGRDDFPFVHKCGRLCRPCSSACRLRPTPVGGQASKREIPGLVPPPARSIPGRWIMLGGCWQRATRVRRETGGRPGRRGAQRLRLPRAPPLRAATGARTGASEACRNLSQTVQRRLATVGRPRRARQEPWERDRHGRARGLRGALRRLGSDPLSCGRPPPSASLAAGTSTAQS
mmetsp:Transcript_14477/g.38480  ORF Transcript_14477/g.38480 Transcript_14477/m.38480 type:complete len:388 (-) Transcript_14477:40-1203(-)